MQGFFAAEGFAVVSDSSNVVVELISIFIRAIRGHCDASDRDHCEIVLGRHGDREKAACSSRMHRHVVAARLHEMS